MKWEGESPRTKEQETYQHTHVFLVQNDDSTSRLSSDQNLKSNEERDQPTENFNKRAELEWPSILSQRLF